MATLKTNTKEYYITDEQYKQLYKLLTDNSIPDDYEIKSSSNLIKKGEILTIEPSKQQINKFYYKVRLSYDDDAEDITITQDELPNVLWAFIHDAKVVTTNGAFRGKDIISILPDYNRIMGWNKGYEPSSIDFALIQRNDRCLQARNYQSKIKELCYEVKSPQELISKSKQLLLS